MGVDELAQRALADVFEQLERIGAAGRERCRGRGTYVTSPPSSPVTRTEALGYIRFAENALDYARVHLDYLASALEPDEPAIRVGERVEVMDEAGPWFGTLHALGADGKVYVRREVGGEMEVVHPRDVTRAPSEAAE